MRSNSLKIAVLVACVVASLTLAAAPASAAVVAPGDLGGGALQPGFHYGTGNVLIGLRVTPDDRVRIDVDLQISCPGETFIYNDYTLAAVATVAPDGTFRATGTKSERGFGYAKLTFEIAGSFTPTGASGTVAVSIPADYPISVPGCSDATFSSGPIAWQARRANATGALGTAGPFAGALLYGVTTQRVRGTQGAVVLRVAADGRTFERAAHQVQTRCMRRRAVTPGMRLRPAAGAVYYDAPAAIRRDGSFVNQQTGDGEDRQVRRLLDRAPRRQVRHARRDGQHSLRRTHRHGPYRPRARALLHPWRHPLVHRTVTRPLCKESGPCHQFSEVGAAGLTTG